MNIETPGDLAEYLANALGVYGACRSPEGVCRTLRSADCCRSSFVTTMTERIRKSVENEQLIRRLEDEVFGPANAARGGE